MSCIFITAILLLLNSFDCCTFIRNTFTYDHNVLNLMLLFGNLFPILLYPMEVGQTYVIDRKV